MRVLVLGATGLLGSTLFRVLSAAETITAYGTIRDQRLAASFPYVEPDRLLPVKGLEDIAALRGVLDAAQPDAVINCLAAPRSEWTDFPRMTTLFSLLPQRVRQLCSQRGIRLIHFSSDGVFSGAKGGYSEDDPADATDDYGVTKLLGEVAGPQALTIRTSLIGHSLRGDTGLVDWLLSQERSCRGYVRAIFSGFPTVVLAEVVRDLLLPRPDLHGIYHLATQPISKFDLLRLIATRYGKSLEIEADGGPAKNLSLSALKFHRAVGYTPPPWPDLVDAMYRDYTNVAQNVQR